MRAIDADKLPVHKAYCVDEAGFGANFYVVDKEDIDRAPTIDAVTVVRCQYCKHRIDDKDFARGHYCKKRPSNGGYFCEDNDFCSYGERRKE